MTGSAKVVRVALRPCEVRTPGDRLPGAERIVVVRADRLGDVVVTLPAFDALRRAYPRAAVALAVRRRYAPLAESVVGVDRVLAVEELRAGLAAWRPDVAVLASRRPAEAFAAFAAGVPVRVGTGGRYFSPLFTHRVRESRRAGGCHEVEYALSFAHRIGAQGAPFAFPEIRDSAGGAAGGEEVLIHPGSGGSCPGWPVERWAELASALEASDLRYRVSIGPADRHLARYFPEGATCRDDLPALLARVRRARVVVTNSTGPLHLAAAVGTATVGIFAPGRSCSPVRWGPYSPRGVAIVAASGRMGELDPAPVLAEIRAALGPQSESARQGENRP